MNIKSIHHIAIICSDYTWSKRFYTEILGFEVLNEIYRAERDSYKLDLKVGEGDYIELFSFPNPPERPSRPEARGLRHLSFAVEDVDAAVEYLIEQGVDVEPVRVDQTTERKYTFFFDPDELPLEIYEV